MDSRLRVAGQAIQPVLVMFPLGLFALAVLFDLAVLLGAPEIIGQLGYWNVVAGLFGGVCATLAGAIDVMLSRGARAKRIGVLQTLMNMGVLIFFTVILMLRMRSLDRVAGGGLVAVELLALGAAVCAAWFGGELVNRPAVRTSAVRTPAAPVGATAGGSVPVRSASSMPRRPSPRRPSPRHHPG